MNGSNYLITNGFGLVGSKLISYLLSLSHDIVNNVIVIGNKITDNKLELFNLFINDKRFKFYQLNLTNSSEKSIYNILNKYHINKFIYLSTTYNNDSNQINDNISNTIKVLNACKKHNVEINYNFIFLLLSSSDVYGNLYYKSFEEHKKNNEQSNTKVYNLKTASLLSCENLVMAWHSLYNISYNILRCSNIYGIYQPVNKLIPTLINQTISNKHSLVQINNQYYNDWLYVDDLVNAIHSISISKLINQIYNISSGYLINELDLAIKIVNIYNKMCKVKRDVNDVIKVNCNNYFLINSIDNTKIIELLGWRTKTSLQKGIEEIIKYYLSLK